MPEESESWTVAIPRPVDRRLHLGPFPSARDALKFAGFAAAGLVAMPLAGPVAIVPFAALGFVVAVHRRDGRSLDERVTGYLGWRWRRRTRRPAGRGAAAPTRAGARTMRVVGSRVAAVVRTGGVPVQYLPPADARALFELTRRWLAALDGPLYVVARTETVDPGPFRPVASPPSGPAEALARAGYSDVVQLLLRRRRIRRVALVLWEPADPAGAARLEVRLAATLEALRTFGVAADRLTGSDLRSELDRLDLRPPGVGMKFADLLRAPTGIDPLRASGGFAALAGAASLVEPYFVGLTGALAAISLVAWASRIAPRGGRRAATNWAVAGSVGVAGAFALLAGPPWDGVRGALLGATAFALAWTSRTVPPFGEVDR